MKHVALQRVAHVPDPWHHNLIAVKPLRKNTQPAEGRLPGGRRHATSTQQKSLIVKVLRRGNSLFEIETHRDAVV